MLRQTRRLSRILPRLLTSFREDLLLVFFDALLLVGDVGEAPDGRSRAPQHHAELWLNPLLKSIFGPQFDLKKNIDAIAFVIIILSLLPMAIQALIEWRSKKKAAAALPVETKLQ